MKQLSLNNIQDMSLHIMKEIHEFCINNNISYSLAYGSLIGAVRHKGFIPWDDDMDIVMPRPDYERFCRTYKGATTKAFASCIGNSYLLYGRVCDMVSTKVSPHTIWATEGTGIWIDVFPIDGISCSYEELHDKGNILRILDQRLFEARGAIDKWNPLRSLTFNLKKAAKRILYNRYKINDIHAQCKNILPISDFETSKYCGVLVFPIGFEKQYFSTSIFKEFVLVDFCDTKFLVIKRYEQFLKSYYGDYMQYPPVEQRQPSHTEHLYFWMNER
jgi:lipopolysaccharide cholinephosphotransferase